MTDGNWVEVGDGVLARRYAELDLTVGLVLGDGQCLVIDTRGDAVQGAELAAAVRQITPDPCTVAITHAHFDHAYGTVAFKSETFDGTAVWAHYGCHTDLAEDGADSLLKWEQRYRREGRADVADALAATELVLPGHLVRDETRLSIGGREVVLAHFGPAHTEHDLVVQVPDAAVVFAGDLVENGTGGEFTAESFGSDSTLSGWPAALEAILALRPRIVVPGHGDPVGPEFVEARLGTVRTLAGLEAAVEAGELTVEAALARSPLPEQITRAALAGVSPVR
ncbi:MBL fold metallo-hydrolase [Amycolatopsis nigrescens]|uniref:MBL fold metallo-hydrolase n=1 Tax=Amycolatopsis nigrescens TaxID=381445 RepID=UPI00036CCD2C|nr:MBL fold metallo-hydrolase [Amycolatopsis nigrescens]